MTQIRQVIEVPAEEFQHLKETSNRILKALENLRIIAPPEFLTPKEFCKETKTSLWKFAMLRSQGKLHVKQVGRKLYIPRSEVQRFFSGEMETSES